MTEKREESELIAQARRGSQSAFEKAVKPYVDELRRHCYRMSASLDDADDLVQETLFRAWRGLGTFSGRSSFRTWLYRIATNRSLDVLGGKAWRDPHSDSVAEFVSAWRSDDVSGLVDLLADDAALTMPPQPLTLRGPAEIVEFLRTTLGELSSTRISRLEANGQPSFAVHAPNTEGLLVFSGIIVLTLLNSSITRMVGFGDTSVAEAFDVPLRQTP